MKQAIKYSNDYIGIVDKPMRKAITLFANKKWQKAYDLFHTDNENSEANLLASFGKLYCAAQLDLSNLEEHADDLLEKTDFEFWPYLKEHNFPRYASRFAYQIKAYLSKEEEQYNHALECLFMAFEIDSPIDDLDNIPLLELKVEIYLEMKNEISTFFTIQKILNIDAENDTFIEITKSKEFKAYIEINDLELLKKGNDNETAIQALRRYDQFLVLHFDDDESEIEMYQAFFFDKTTEEDVIKTENRLQFKFPPSYRNFIIKYGLFRLGQHNDYERNLLLPTEMKTLHYELESQWSEGCENMTEKQLKGSKDLITFSFGDEGLQSVWYYCFDKRSLNTETGEMSVYSFSQDDWNFETLEICNPDTYATYTNRNLQNNFGFDKHISTLIDEQIESLLEY